MIFLLRVGGRASTPFLRVCVVCVVCRLCGGEREYMRVGEGEGGSRIVRIDLRGCGLDGAAAGIRTRVSSFLRLQL